ASAIALRFAQEHDDIADEVADAVGASNGEVYMQRYAKETAMSSAVQDVQFDPIDHLCMATVRWQPPIFIKEAIMKFAQKMKEKELAGTPGNEPAPAAPAAAAPAAAAPPPRASTPPPPAVSVASPPAAAPSGPSVPACTRERAKLTKTLKKSQKALDNFAECKRRTSGDETICHRYKLYVEDAQKKEEKFGRALTSCLNGGLSTNLRRALADALPGHAAVSVETSAAGNPIFWTFSPVNQTSFAVEMSAEGREIGRTPLAANQVQWVRQQLGF
ncbi:MAG: hypothetical protein V3T05_09000, partial [Myxococcota bacterium]